VENIDSVNGSHFTANIIKELIKVLEIKWDYHTPWHLLFLESVEKINQTLIRQITKLTLETKLPGTKCLPIALL
jgi:hypothetical protein